MSDEKIIEEAVKSVTEAKKPGTFNIINVLNNRAYPKDEVNIYLDEQAAYDASKIKEKIDELSKSTDLDMQAKIDSLLLEQEAIVEKLNLSKVVFTVSGMSEGMREDLQAEALEKFPMEYEEDKNPFTGEVTKRELESKDRDRYFTNLLWHSSIDQIVDNDGNVQDKVSIDDIAQLRKSLPIAAIGAITQSIEKLRISTAMFMMSVDEDFLAKS